MLYSFIHCFRRRKEEGGGGGCCGGGICAVGGSLTRFERLQWGVIANVLKKKRVVLWVIGRGWYRVSFNRTRLHGGINSQPMNNGGQIF